MSLIILAVAAGMQTPVIAANSTTMNQEDYALIILDPADSLATYQAIQYVEMTGGHIVHVFPPHVLIGSVPPEAESNLLGQTGIIRIAREAVDPVSVEAYGQTAVAGVQTWNDLFASPGAVPDAMALSQEEITADLVNDALEPPDLPFDPAQDEFETSAQSSGFAPGYYQTSDYMIGDVAVGIILPESNGSDDPSTENWTAEERQLVYSEIVAACNWWAARESRAHLRFFYDDHFSSPVPTRYEPIIHPHSEQGLWIGEVMGNLGYSAASYFTRVRDYNNDLRQAYGTDWAFTIFVVDSSNDSDNYFSDGYFAYAYLGGPFTVMTYGNNGYGPSNMDAVTAHEMGHIFLALDQYSSARQPCTRQAGYLSVENQNSLYGGCSSNESSIMRGQVSPYRQGAVDLYARGQIGWWDTNANGVLDPLDTDPQVSLNTHMPNPTEETTLTYTGSVVDIPWDSPTRPDATINTIESVEYRVNEGAWQLAAATDGAFDGASEDFTFTVSGLTEGRYNIEVRAINSAGKVSAAYASDSVLVYDPGQVGPFSTLIPYQPDPTTTRQPTYSGTAKNVYQGAEGMVVMETAAIVRVDYRLNHSGEWLPATAADGSFDSAEEAFTFTTPELSQGTHVVEVRATNSMGQTEVYPASDSLEVVGQSGGDYRVFIPLVVKRK
ncbi:MAG: fibronectin type III domain-containing protein [Chloroflexota bacterium]|nr:fibronectin type III domain-containing protein [Chloroflexota bacterium]